MSKPIEHARSDLSRQLDAHLAAQEAQYNFMAGMCSELEKLLYEACEAIRITGKPRISSLSPALRDWYGSKRAAQRKASQLPMEKWQD